MDPSEIVQVQLDKLNELLANIVPQNSFYSAKAKESHLTSPIRSLDDFTHRFPFTTKTELVEDQKVHPPYGTNLSYPLSAYSRCHQTSGTSGTPLSWLDTESGWKWMLKSWETVFSAADVTSSDRILFAFSFGPFLGFWTAFEAATGMGCFCFAGGGLSTAGRLRIIHTHRISVICCTPTYALRLGGLAGHEENMDISSVKSIIVAGEPGGNIRETVKRIESCWNGARVVDHHGMTEVGPVSYTTAEQPNVLRIIETAYIAEIIDPHTLEPVEPGNEGELVLTTLGRFGSPLLRYRTGDLVRGIKSSSSPEILSSYHLDCGILGRIDDMVVIRGVNIYPSAIENIIRTSPYVAEYQVLLKKERNMMEMEIQIEPTSSCSHHGDAVQYLIDEFKTEMSLRVPVTVVPEGTLPRFEMKAKRWNKSSC